MAMMIRISRWSLAAVVAAALALALGEMAASAQAAPAAAPAPRARTSALTAIYDQTSAAVVRVFNNREYSSGTVVSADGLLVTHIDIAKKDTLDVLTTDGHRVKARLLLRDAATQLAILRLMPGEVAAPATGAGDDGEGEDGEAPAAGEAKPMDATAVPAAAEAVAAEAPAPASEPTATEAKIWPFVKLGDSSHATVGAWVATVAYPVGSDMKQFTQPAFSAGLLAGRGKFESGLKYTGELLMTDATANAGSQGGALINREGEVVGILMLPVLYKPTGSALNVALPAEVVAPLVKKAVETPDAPMEKVPVAGQAYLGVTRDATETGCRVSGTVPGSPAEKAGMKPGDLIKTVNGEAVETFEALSAMVAKMKPGEEVKMTVLRGEGAAAEMVELKVTLGKRE